MTSEEKKAWSKLPESMQKDMIMSKREQQLKKQADFIVQKMEVGKSYKVKSDVQKQVFIELWDYLNIVGEVADPAWEMIFSDDYSKIKKRELSK
jgi:hypothetical protein